MVIKDLSTLERLSNKVSSILGFFTEEANKYAVGTNARSVGKYVGQLVEFRFNTLNRYGKVLDAKVVGERKTLHFKNTIPTTSFSISFIDSIAPSEWVKNAEGFEYDEKTDTLNTKTATIPEGNEQKIKMIWVIDESGSMAGVRDLFSNAITQKANKIISDSPQYVDIDIIRFGSVVEDTEYSYFSTRKLAQPTYRLGSLGMTALNDAIIKAIKEARRYLGLGQFDRVLVEVFTDGGENDSRNKPSSVRSDILSVNSDQRFMIAFTGPASDKLSVYNYAEVVGIDRSNVLLVENGAQGVRSYATISTQANLNYTAASFKGDFVTSNFYMDKG